MAKSIPIANGESVLVDDRDARRVSKYRWHGTHAGNSVTIRRNVPAREGSERSMQALHTMLMRPPGGAIVVHLNGDPYDCRRENLRVTNRGGGQIVRKNHSSEGFSSPYYGVSWNKRTRKWQVVLRVDGSPKWIGSYEDELDAAEAYDKAARKVHGRRALQNFV